MGVATDTGGWKATPQDYGKKDIRLELMPELLL